VFCRLCSLCSCLANNQKQKTGAERPDSMLRFLPSSDLERSPHPSAGHGCGMRSGDFAPCVGEKLPLCRAGRPPSLGSKHGPKGCEESR
jgi:hypothetical protein